jgi:hypothetical protein
LIALENLPAIAQDAVRMNPAPDQPENTGPLRRFEQEFRRWRKRVFSKKNVPLPPRPLRLENAPLFPRDVRVAVYFNTAGNYFFQEIAQLFQCGMAEEGFRCELRDELRGPADADIHFVVAPHEFFILGLGKECLASVRPENIFLLNTEQRQTSWFQKALAQCGRARHIFDMDLETAGELQRLGFSASHLPLGYVENFPAFQIQPVLPATPETAPLAPEVVNWRDDSALLAARPLDLSFVGEANPRRAEFFRAHAARFEKFRCSLRLMPSGAGPWKAGDAENALRSRLTAGISQRSKIVLNLHRDERHYFEWHRIVMTGIWQRALVITETVTDAPPFLAGVDFVQASLAELPDAIEYYLRDPRGIEQAEAIRNSGFNKLRNELRFEKILRAAWRPFLEAAE